MYQIQNALPWALPYVAYRTAFEAVVAWMSFVELDFVRIVPMSCMMPYSFFDKLFVSTIFPLILATVILVLGRIASRRRSDPAEQRAMDLRVQLVPTTDLRGLHGRLDDGAALLQLRRYETVDAAGRS